MDLLERLISSSSALCAFDYGNVKTTSDVDFSPGDNYLTTGRRGEVRTAFRWWQTTCHGARNAADTDTWSGTIVKLGSMIVIGQPTR
jgi:hypothetical protein